MTTLLFKNYLKNETTYKAGLTASLEYHGDPLWVGIRFDQQNYIILDAKWSYPNPSDEIINNMFFVSDTLVGNSLDHLDTLDINSA